MHSMRSLVPVNYVPRWGATQELEQPDERAEVVIA